MMKVFVICTFICGHMFAARTAPSDQMLAAERFLEDQDTGFNCDGRLNGLYPDPDDCAGFIQCWDGRMFHKKCGKGTRFNSRTKVCDWPENVTCPEFCASKPNGIYADPETCKGFIYCHNYRTTHQPCPEGTLFNPKLKVCDWPDNVDCPIDPDGSGDD